MQQLESLKRFTASANLHVRGYKEKGNINTPLELALQNVIDGFSPAMGAANWKWPH